MRYKEGEYIEPLAKNASDDMLVLTAIIGVLVGIVLTILGRMGKQMWMWVWGIGLVFCSAYLGISLYFDIKLFGHF